MKTEIRKRLFIIDGSSIMFSLQIVTLNPDVPVECELEDLRYTGPDFAELESLLSEMEFRKLLKELIPEKPRVEEEGVDFQGIADVEGLKSLVDELKGLREFSVTLSLTEDGFGGRSKGLSFGLGDKKARYIPVGIDALSERSVADALKSVIEDPATIKQTDNSKALYLYFSKMGIEARGVEMDTSLASYIVNPSKPDHSISSLGYELLGVSPEEVRDGADIVTETRVECKKASNILDVAGLLKKELEADDLWGLYSEIELPLARVLSEMEAAGIRVDAGKLAELSKEIEIALTSLEREIYAASGMEFNINSPRQLAELLFEKLKLKPTKKTKTGFSTDEEVLTQLAAQHDVPRLIINFRQLSKLKSTYVDALGAIVNPSTGRIHTSFNQTVTATGRLSSSRPNLQNIPIRGEMAGRIREAFVADAGCHFICADYSQIELRIVAHLSNDPILVDSFMKGEDIHTRTASEVFGIMPALVTGEMRRRAKAINFGIIYGMGSYGLSTELKIPMKEAQEYINRYFDRYKEVKVLIDATIAEASQAGIYEDPVRQEEVHPRARQPRRVHGKARPEARHQHADPGLGSRYDKGRHDTDTGDAQGETHGNEDAPPDTRRAHLRGPGNRTGRGKRPGKVRDGEYPAAKGAGSGQYRDRAGLEERGVASIRMLKKSIQGFFNYGFVEVNSAKPHKLLALPGLAIWQSIHGLL